MKYGANSGFLLLACALWCTGCEKLSRYQETSFACALEDPTSGKIDASGTIYLMEMKVNRTLFEPDYGTVLESYKVPFGSTFTGTFKARRNWRYTYQLVYIYADLDFGVDIVDAAGRYETIDDVTLEKGEFNDVKMVLVPHAMLHLGANNRLGDADPEDSIWIELKEQYLSIPYSAKGIGHSPMTFLRVPHGHYTLSYWVFRNDSLDEAVSYPLYLRHELDTMIEVEF